MKKIVILIFCAFLIVACGQNKKAKTETERLQKEMSEITGQPISEDAKNCDEFIDQYEKWTDDYLKFLEKYMKNPMDPDLMNKYMELAQQGTDWAMQWNGKLGMCATKEKYQKRFDEISDKMEKEMKKLGLE